MTLFRTLLVLFLVGGSVVACGGDDDTTTAGDGDGDGDGDIDAMESDPAADFCAMYDDICGYGNAFGGDPYTDLTDCVTRFNGYVASRQACVVFVEAAGVG